MKMTTQLRKMLKEDGVIITPGMHDALSARIAEKVGFRCLYLGSSATCSSMLGITDVGFVTQSEMLRATRNICSVVNIPVVSDGENGFGSAMNVTRTIREFEREGAAGIHIEDCMPPKHVRGIRDRVTSKEEMVEKVKAAVDSRQDKDFVIVARTDAKGVYGLDEAVARCQAYAEAGADMAFIVGLTVDEAASVSRQIPVPLFAISMYAPLPELTQKGIKLSVYPSIALSAAYPAMLGTLQDLFANGPTSGLRKPPPSLGMADVNGMDEVVSIVTKYHLV